MKNVRFVSMLISVSAAALLMSGNLFAQSPVAQHGRLSVDGARIVGENGQPVQLRGMSLYWSIGRTAGNFYNKDAVKFLADNWKASVIRAAMGVEDCWDGRGDQTGTGQCNADERGYLYDAAGNRSKVEAVVDGAIEAGIYVIIDWHSHIAERFQAQAIAFFEDMARKYKDHPNVIYEIYNEPIGSRTNPDSTWRAIKPYMQAVTNAIRAIDPHNLIIIGTPYYCQRPDVAASDPVTGDNLAYALHFYSGDNAHRVALRNNASQTMNMGKAVFVTEFGTCNAQGKGSHNAAETDIWMQFMDQFKISWANWSLSTVNETASALTSGASSNGGNWNSNLTASGSYIRGKLATPPLSEKYFFTVAVNVVGEGTFTVTPRNAPYYKGATVTLEATPKTADGWKFSGWSGDLSGDSTMLRFEIDRDMELTALFEKSSAAAAPAVSARAARWSVRRSNGGLMLTGPASGNVFLYDLTGRLVGRFGYDGGAELSISGRKIPTGNYLLVVRGGASGREIYRTRVSMNR